MRRSRSKKVRINSNNYHINNNNNNIFINNNLFTSTIKLTSPSNYYVKPNNNIDSLILFKVLYMYLDSCSTCTCSPTITSELGQPNALDGTCMYLQ